MWTKVLLAAIALLLIPFVYSMAMAWRAEDWQQLEAISTVATAVLVLGGSFFMIEQLYLMWRQNQIALTEKRLEELNSPEMKEALEIIYKSEEGTLDKLNAAEKKKVIDALEKMHSLGLLTKEGYTDKILAIKAHRGKYIRCWFKLSLYICKERKIRGKYAEGIEWLAKEAYKWQQEKLRKEEWVKLDREYCEIDISKTCEDIVA